MYRDIDRNIHVCACRGIHARVQIGWLIETYMYMHVCLCTDILVESYMSMQVVSTSKHIWAKLSSEFWAELTYKLGPSCLGQSFMWAGLVLGHVVCNWCWTWRELAAMRLSESFLRTLCG